jgi:hypothetical protein
VYYIVGITPVVSVGQMATPSIRTENDLNVDIGCTYPIAVSSPSESSTVGSSTCTTTHNNSPSTGRHALLVARSPQEQHDYNQQGSSIIRCHTFLPNIKYIELNLSCHIPQNIKLQLILNFSGSKFEHRYYIIKVQL